MFKKKIIHKHKIFLILEFSSFYDLSSLEFLEFKNMIITCTMYVHVVVYDIKLRFVDFLKSSITKLYEDYEEKLQNNSPYKCKFQQNWLRNDLCIIKEQNCDFI
jgi:hypothetical protein